MYEVLPISYIDTLLTVDLQISDGCKRSWVTHLRGGISLLDKISQTPELRNDKLLSFLRMYFVAHDIMSRTACDEDIVDQRCEWVEDDTIDEIDVMMGCSRSLMNLVREISSLASHAKIVRCSLSLIFIDLC